MSTRKEVRFQLFEYSMRIDNHPPVDRFIYSSQFDGIITVHNQTYEFVFENVTGRPINYLLHPIFNRPHLDVAFLLEHLLKYKSTVSASRANEGLLVYKGIYDLYLIPTVQSFSSETILPSFKSAEKLWISEAQLIGSPTYFVEIFQIKLWLSFVMFFLVTGFLSVFLLGRLKKFTTKPLDTFEWFSLITNQGVGHNTIFLSNKILLLSLSILTIIFYGSFEAFLSSCLAMRKPDLQFNDLTGLLKTKDYSICIPMISSDVLTYVESRMRANQMSVDRINDEHCPALFRKLNFKLQSFYEESDKNCPDEKTAIISANLWGLFKNNGDGCHIMPLPGNYFPNYITLPTSRGFKYREHFNRGIIRLMTAGHIDYLDKRNRRERKTKEMHQYMYMENGLISIDLHQAQLIFAILMCGLAPSLLVLLVEKILNQSHHN